MPTVTDARRIHSTDPVTGRNGDPEHWGLKPRTPPTPSAPPPPLKHQPKEPKR